MLVFRVVININHHHPLNIPPQKKNFQQQLPTTQILASASGAFFLPQKIVKKDSVPLQNSSRGAKEFANFGFKLISTSLVRG